MNRKLKTTALAAGATLALLAGGGSPVVGATDPVAATTVVDAFPPPTGEYPADWPILVDDTQILAIAVPGTWNQVDTVPAQNDDGTARPWISATNNEVAFFPSEGAADAFSAPGVVYVADPYAADTAAMLASSDLHAACTADPVQTFTNGTYTGHVQSFNGCGGTATRVVQVAAHPADAAFTALVLVQLTGQPDDANTLNGVLSSIGRHVPQA